MIQDIALQRGYLDPFTQRDIRKRLLAALSEAVKRGDVVKTGRGIYAVRPDPGSGSEATKP